MSLSQFSTDQIIKFCFSDYEELTKRIKDLESEFVEYSLRVKKGETFSEWKHNNLLYMIEVLKTCQSEQHRFVNELLNGKAQ